MRSVLLICALAGCSSPPPPHPLAFQKITLDENFQSEGVAVFDVDHDGHPDIVTDMYWYAGPSMTPHEIRDPEVYDPATTYSKGFAIYGVDVDGDGWTDVIDVGFPVASRIYWYRNPAGQDVHWDRFDVNDNDVPGLETPIVANLFGKPVLISTDTTRGILGWYDVPADPTQPWTLQPISDPGFPAAGAYAHGIGVGDLDRDGRLDVLTGWGWFQQTDAGWTFNEVPFGQNQCSQIHVYDVDGDGLEDVFCSRPHDYGFYWLHNEGDGTFTQNLIDDTISQMHALLMADLDGDGVPELVSGKRFWAHGPDGDPGHDDPALLTYWKLHPGPAWERVDVDDDSGIGTSFAIADADGDGRPDIVSSNKKGLHWFRSQ
jgi:hypothetical protein